MRLNLGQLTGKSMPTPEKILREMDNILNDLLKTAERLQSISHQVISKEELALLQSSQSKLVDQLVELDDAFKNALKGQPLSKDLSLRESIEKKLALFEKLNANFIENLTSSQPLLKLGTSKKRATPPE